MQQGTDVDVVLGWSRTALRALGESREEIDAVNVFPVADSDTGTNLYLTFESGVAAAAEAPPRMDAVMEAMARGALHGARGNSGTILAQLLRGLTTVLAADGADLSDGAVFAAALRTAVDAAYAAVGEPVEGTMLTVARAAADAATALPAGASLETAVVAAAAAARTALAATPEQLAVLRQADVVDAGGLGLVVLLDSWETTLTGRRALARRRWIGDAPMVPTPAHRSADPDGPEPQDSPAYEVMYLLTMSDDQVDDLRRSLQAVGDSVVVAGGAGEWQVHVHTDDAGAAVEAGLAAGTPRQVSITHLETEHRRAQTRVPAHSSGSGARSRQGRTSSRRIVAVAAGDGIAALFAEAGAEVVRTSIGHRPSGAELVAALHGSGPADSAHTEPDEIVVLPNERDLVAVAEAAVAEIRAAGHRAAVIPTVAQVQGLAAAAVHEPARTFDADVVAMTAAASHTRHGGLTIATQAAVTSAGVCAAGDVLGVVDGDFVVIGSDPVAVAIEVVGRMLAPGGELVTVVTGAKHGSDGPDPVALADAVTDAVGRDHPDVDVVVCAGGQPRYPLLVGVE